MLTLLPFLAMVARRATFAILGALTVLFIFDATGAYAQTLPAAFTPAAPTSLTTIRARFGLTSNCDAQSASTIVLGTVVRTTVQMGNCTALPPVGFQTFADFGPLPASTYTYEIYLAFPNGSTEFRSAQPLVVLDPPPPAVPTLSPWMIIALAATLGVTAVFLLRRTG